ncbi:MAG: ASPIC/UnbV domain protein, partial [Gemmatimonadetes bacterium]|nr:ASPIC/UnbV domain protein [Gemmatimonadota bacterium]
TYPGRTSRAGSTTTTVADVDGDGWLDIFTANYKAYTMQDSLPPQVIAFDQIVRQTGPREFVVRPQYQKDYRVIRRDDLRGVSLVQRADPDDFYLNRAGAGFERIPLTADRFRDAEGKPLPFEPESFGLAARFVDIDGDRDPDLYVANDFEDPDEFWINDGRGNFRLIEPTAQRTASNSTMAVDFADVDRDGWTDMLQVDMLGLDSRQLKTQMPTHTALPKQPGVIEDRPQMQRNTLFLNRGDRTFAQVAEYAGITGSGWSWSTLFTDADLDGWEDILIGTGHPWDLMDADTQQRLRNRMVGVDWRRIRWEYPPLKLPNVAFRNRGDLTFEDVSKAWGFGVEDDISHGLAIGDLDGDGDQDVILNRLESPVAILRNDAPAPRIAVRLVGEAPNTGAIGSRIKVLGGPVPVQTREVSSGGLYLSHSDLLQTFATGTADTVTIEVEWRDGRHTVIPGARPNRLYEIAAATAAGTVPADSNAAPAAALFEDWTAALGHRHVETDFDDYSRQLLLPNGLSQLGPGVAWVDMDRDGDEDLAIGAGRGGRLALYRNDGGRLMPAAAGLPPAEDDQAGMVGVPDGDGMRLLVAISNYERLPGAQLLSVAPVRQFTWSGGRLHPGADLGIPGDSASVGPIAAADYDLDGDLDLFVGGRVAPGAYPISPSSRLFRNEGGRFVLDRENSRLLAGNGMVSAALFADVDGDGDDDLLLALEWGPIRLLLNERGRFGPAPERWGLSGLYSRWNGIAAGDLDGDGRLDLVVTSWGRNTTFQADSARPLLLYFGPFGSRGETEMLLAREDPRLGAVAPFGTFGRVGYAIPSITQRLRTYHAWADATIDQVLGPDAGRAITFGATTLDHLALMNRGGHFEPVPLPREAQFAPAFYAGIADFDGDGSEDVFLSQNFFATEISVPRLDAGRSLLFRGDGQGGLTPVPGQVSGLKVYGEQRGAAYADMDGDGRLDLVVSQNAAPTRLFHNTGARPGLRVRLAGPAGNPDGVGAQIRVVYGDRMGPVREVHAGSGYWSQNGAVQVFGLSGTPTGVWVRWPGGKTDTVAVAGGATEVRVSS